MDAPAARFSYIPPLESAKIGVKIPSAKEDQCANSRCSGWLPPFHLAAADPRIGSWTLISAQSSLDPPNKISITPLHDGVHVVTSGDTHLDFTAKWDGHEASVQGNPAFNQIELRRIDKHQAEVKEKKDGDLVATVRDKISTDGNELTGHHFRERPSQPDHRVDANRGRQGRR